MGRLGDGKSSASIIGALADLIARGAAMRWGIGGERRSVEQIKRDGWHDQNILVVSADDRCLTWPEREFIRQLGNRLYGKRQNTEARHG